MGDINYLFEPEGSELHWDGLKDKPPPPQAQQASLSGAAPSYTHASERQGLVGTQMSATKVLPPGTKAPPMASSHEDIMSRAKAMLEAQTAQQEAQMQAGPATADRAAGGQVLPEWLKAAAGR